MNSDDLRNLLNERPFRPLRLHMGNGRTVDVTHPEAAIVAEEIVAVGVIDDEAPTPRTIRVLSLININEVEFLPAVR